MNISPAKITHLKPDEIFVFGSNTQGRHGKGAALDARRLFGAVYGVGFGRTGQCYAIATKDHHLRVVPLDGIAVQVERFILYATAHPELQFLVTEIGCGLAGYTPSQIALMFSTCPENVALPESFWKLLLPIGIDPAPPKPD